MHSCVSSLRSSACGAAAEAAAEEEALASPSAASSGANGGGGGGEAGPRQRGRLAHLLASISNSEDVLQSFGLQLPGELSPPGRAAAAAAAARATSRLASAHGNGGGAGGGGGGGAQVAALAAAAQAHGALSDADAAQLCEWPGRGLVALAALLLRTCSQLCTCKLACLPVLKTILH